MSRESGREHVLERIRAAYRGIAQMHDAGAAHDARVAAVDLPRLPDPQDFDDPAALFIDRAREVGVTVDQVASVDAAAERAAAWCAGRGVRRAAVWETPALAPLMGRLVAAGVEVLSPGAPLDALARADVGITGAEWGIAETATLVLASAPDQPRLTSLLPPAHLALLRADRIVPDLPALFARCGPLPSALTFITGPSRSADIGLVPVLGAHGPTTVAVLLVGR